MSDELLFGAAQDDGTGVYADKKWIIVAGSSYNATTNYDFGVARYKEIARGQILGDPNGMLKLIFHIDTKKILGVWCLGTQATELVHIGQAVMRLKGTAEYFIETVFNYPTLAECYKVAAFNGRNKIRCS